MTAREGIRRIMWRFGQGRAFTPNENDINAINAIEAAQDNTAEITARNNEAFFRLYIFTLSVCLHYSGKHFLEPELKRMIFENIRKSRAFLLGDFLTLVNARETEHYHKKYGLDYGPDIPEGGLPVKEWAEKRKADRKKFVEVCKNNPEALDELTKEHFNYEDVGAMLTADVNEFLEGFYINNQAQQRKDELVNAIIKKNTY